MAVLTRIVAAATILSLAFADIAGASAAENYAVAAKHARSRHNERAARVNASGGEIKKRNVQKRCKPATTSLTSSTHAPTSPANHVASTTSHHTTTTKTTSKAPATTTKAKQVTNSGGGSKKGLAWSGTGNELTTFVNSGQLDGGILYNWAEAPPTASGMLSCSMLWGDKNLAGFRQHRSSYDCLMGMNECNLAAQSNLSPSAAASMWKSEILPFGSGKTLIAPSVTTAEDGIPWLQGFFQECTNCNIDMLSAHVYDTDFSVIETYLNSLHAAFPDIDIYVSEFGCLKFYGDEAPCPNPTGFMQDAISFFESTPWVSKYSAYGFSSSLGSAIALIGDNGKPTSLGNTYLYS